MAKVYQTTFKLGGELSPAFSSVFKKAEGKIKGIRDDAKETQGVFAKLSKSASNFGGVLSKVAQFTGAYALVSGVTDAFSNVVSSVGGFQESMAQLRASTGASKEEMEALSVSTKNLYKQNLGEDWNDLANAIALTKQVTQKQGAELEATTKNAIVYRDVFGEDIRESIKASDTMARNFGITSSQAFNLLAQGAQKGLNKSDELLDSANEYAPYFKTLGFSANQMFDTFSAGLESGAFNLDKVGYTAHGKLLFMLGRLMLVFTWRCDDVTTNKIISREAVCGKQNLQRLAARRRTQAIGVRNGEHLGSLFLCLGEEIVWSAWKHVAALIAAQI
ncbi:phage tail tape measure protein [Brevibacillus laterosporus]|uniref:phage tail tape measure protein n=1 Tax=Brevibacillus laterosporus TaxID=1465 RepID=UPI003D1F95FF